MAQQLPHRRPRAPPQPFTIPLNSAALAGALTITQLFDSLAIRIDGKRAWGTTASIRGQFTDSGETFRMELSNGALVHHNGVQVEGDVNVLATITGLADQPDTAFAIITP